MRILLLTPSFPYPAHQGGALRNLGLIRGLIAAGHTVDVASFHDDPPAALESPLAQELGALEVVATPARSRQVRLRSMALSLQPDMAFRLESGAMRAALRRMLRAQRYDIIQYEGLEMAIYMAEARALAPGARHIYDAHNAEHLLQQRIAEVEWEARKRAPMAIYSSIQAGRLMRFERLICTQADAVLAVSDEDAAALRRIAPNRPVHLIPNGIAVADYGQASSSLDLGPHALVFTGKMDYRPNIDAMLWFADQALPLITAQVPDVALYVVGQRPHGSLQSLAQQPNIHVTGFVASVQPFLDAAAAYVAPLRMGSGTRLKLLEAMASGCAVVATPEAASGLSENLLGALAIADTPEVFADTVARVLTQPDVRAELGRKARARVGEYDWSAIVPRLLAVYGEMTDG
jgi:glycosyltransferase involved in cell wall biosynthesis